MHPKGLPLKLVFHHYESTSGLVDADFTVSLFVDGAQSADAVTVAESADVTGCYVATFTPSVEGLYFADIYETADGSVHYQQDLQVSDEVVTARKYLANNLKKVGTTVTIYEDDGTTVLAQHKTTDAERTAI